MARRKIREQRSKLQGTKEVLLQLNTAAHVEAHSNPASGVATTGSFITTAKWGFD